MNREVAIKLLHGRLARNPDYLQRFVKEAHVAARCSHNNIVQAIDVGSAGGHHFFVMELIKGQTIAEMLQGPKKIFGEKEATEIILQIAHALDHAARRGLVHRDIKPSNIFILSNGHVKILDFGIAKLFGQGNEMTQTGTQMGTPIFMSPEQIRGEKSIDHRSDIYSLGVTLFVAVSGKTPYDSKTESQFDIFNKIVHESLPEISGNEKFNAIIKKACNKDREQRFQSCGEWLEEMKGNKTRLKSILKQLEDEYDFVFIGSNVFK
jgi:serine/threonine-protein kinase